MENRICQDTWDLWVENIDYLIDNTDRYKVADEILHYLQDEGAFTLIKEESRLII